MNEEKLKRLNNYFDKYIDRMIIKDIKLLKERNSELKFSYPYILLVCSGIDFFGGIECGFLARPKNNSSERFKWFVKEWMGRINNLYKEKSLVYLIYDSWRCGVMHQAILKKGFETCSYKYPRNRHLNYIQDQDNERVFIHSLQFADDFIEAQKLYRQHIIDNISNPVYIESLHDHLLNMIRENKRDKEQNLNQFIEILKNNNMVFNSTLIDDNDSVTPSMPPAEGEFLE
ncbi:MAG: hypothetical protein Q8N21_01140 [bacterium]|nr:hypothetical protein [bacterium]